jgi:beta-ureidopropionase / N-carbamoyl-L-amino-acid hydrolase
MDTRKLSEEIFSGVLDISRDSTGVTRAAYGETETQTIAFLEEIARRFNIHTFRDPAANVVFEQDAAAEAPYILIGSHLDTVPKGGNYDGLAGVAAGLVLLCEFQQTGVRPPVPVKAIGFRGEESAWFGVPYLGSKSLLGKITPTELEALHRDTQKPFKDYLLHAGADVDRIAQGIPLLNADRVAAFIELHIEQGPIMVDRKLPVASVAGIRGNLRHRCIRCLGEAGHSGAVPRWLRHDAVFAASELITRIDDHWNTILQHGGDVVLTFGILSTNPQEHAMTRIPGDVSFSFEARSQNDSTLNAMEALLHSECETIEHDRRVSFEFDPIIRTPSALLDRSIVERFSTLIESEGLVAETIPSGAGHDAAVFANAGVPTGMLFIRNQNGSHNPREEMDMEDFLAAVRILRRFILEY